MNLLGLGLVVLSAFLLLILSLVKRKSPPKLRAIPALTRLYRAVGLSVEDGTRLLIRSGKRQSADTKWRRSAGRAGAAALSHGKDVAK